ncbi:amidase [Terriglobus sp. TAA 43]|uniref:amidase n=1 Tax=Terriglobus sp. TAA 43 TaxID=278961 RepID=UPI000646CCC5|nr:amidase [Terriglobus sp. TAA 43]
MRSIGDVLQQLHSGATTSRMLVEQCLTNIADPNGEGARTFTRINDKALQQANEADALLREGNTANKPLLGLPISVKDLFDVEGETTTAGSVVLSEEPPADQDAAIIARVRSAGAVIIGRTNMTEFAYSGLGLNPHYGTPANPWDRAHRRIPGGSSSGAAISVTDDMAIAAIGTDTGGSVRIPSALCGLTGFKPTAGRIPLHGTVPLARSLDSVGPLAATVDCCARLDAVLSGESYTPQPAFPLSNLKFGILQGYVLEGLDDATATAFQNALLALKEAGATIEPVEFPALARIPASNQTAAAEAYAWHRRSLATNGHRYDPHVSTRILHGANMLAADLLDLMQARREIITESMQVFAGYDAILLPTTPIIAPPIADLEQDDTAYFNANGLMLRNTSIFNFLDGCGLSVPCHRHGEAPVGLMIAGTHGHDAHILRVGSAIEAALSPLRQ